MAKNMRPGPAWVPGRIVAQNGPLLYEILTDDSQVWKRHVNHLKVLEETVEMQPSHAESSIFDFDLEPNITPTEEAVHPSPVAPPDNARQVYVFS